MRCYNRHFLCTSFDLPEVGNTAVPGTPGSLFDTRRKASTRHAPRVHNPTRRHFDPRSAMRRLVSGLLLVLLFTLPVLADEASSAYNRGRRAEQEQNYQQAYENFRRAYELKPKEVRYKMAFERS